MTIEPGLYLHFKGNYYRVIGEVLDTDKNQLNILYQSVYGDYYCRSIEGWIEPAQDTYGNQIERYRRVGN